MAFRPIFIATKSTEKPVSIKPIEFEWVHGRSKIQKQKLVKRLHYAANSFGIENILEASSKSENELGVSLSAFNLCGTYGENEFPVECIYQSSKVFLNGGPFKSIMHLTPYEAKKDKRLRQSGELINFEHNGMKWLKEPETAFYDWIYINAVARRSDLLNAIEKYWAFTDIEFNPSKQISCQARSLALLRNLMSRNMLDQVLRSRELFLDQYPPIVKEQGTLDLFSFLST